jgi:hypothetical protein
LSDEQKVIWLRRRTRLVNDTVETIVEKRLRLLEARVAALETKLVGQESLLGNEDRKPSG